MGNDLGHASDLCLKFEEVTLYFGHHRRSWLLRQVSMQCRNTLSTFLTKVKKYQPSLQLGGSGNHLKDSLRKVQWALYTKDDIAHFQLEIRGHVDSILILLGMLQR